MTKLKEQHDTAPSTAAQNLAALLERQATLKTELLGVSRAGDAENIITLTRESDELPTRIYAARLAALRERINTLEPQTAEAKRVVTDKAEATEALRLELADVTAQYEVALQASFAASSFYQGVSSSLADARREMDRLARGRTHAAPLVRSLPHA